MNPTTCAMVPADVAADGKTVIGMDAEVFTAVAAKLGLTAQVDPYGAAPYGLVTAKKGAITADQVKVDPAE